VSARTILTLGVVVAVVSCAPEKTPAGDSAKFMGATGVLASEQSKWIVSLGGIGPVRFGMTLAEAANALHDSTILATDARASCTYVRPKHFPHGTALMISNGVVVRVDVDSADVITDTGLGVGDSEVAVLVRNSGRAKIQSNKYRGPLAHDLVVTSTNDPNHLMIFETDGRSIQQYRAGTRAAVELVERCG
jgi:hypothetical protein